MWLVHLAGIKLVWLLLGAVNVLCSRPFETDKQTKWRLILLGPIGIVNTLYRKFFKEAA